MFASGERWRYGRKGLLLIPSGSHGKERSGERFELKERVGGGVAAPSALSGGMLSRLKHQGRSPRTCLSPTTHRFAQGFYFGCAEALEASRPFQELRVEMIEKLQPPGET